MAGDALVIQLPRDGEDLIWTVHDVARKLALRDSLPGAHVFDRVAEGLKRSDAQGQPLPDRLAFALPASWLVNNKAPSPVLRAWRHEAALPAWSLLVERLQAGTDAWRAFTDDDKQELSYALEALLVPPKGGLCAVSKVLALLCPRAVPLLDDAAIALLTGGVDMPASAEQPTAGPEHFVPAMDAFAAAVEQAAEQGMEQLTRAGEVTRAGEGVDELSLTPAQVLDRLLWVDSWGHRHFKGQLEQSAVAWSVRLPPT